MTFKLICLIIFAVCAVAVMIIPKIFNEKKYPSNTQRIKLIVRVRMILFLAMMILLFICVVTK